MREPEIVDAYGNRHRVVRCSRGGWAIWTWSSRYRAWVGDPPARGPFRTRREALAEAQAIVRQSELAREYERQLRS
jgi:hypothetical protein